MKKEKIEKIHTNGDQVMILKQNKWKFYKPILPQMGKK
jgi:hypothetical protein